MTDLSTAATDLWSAPAATGPVDATVTIPGSKSVTNRALVLAALGRRPCLLHAPLRARDTDLMAAGLQAMGTGIFADGADCLISPERLVGPSTVDVGNAGTVMRFLPAVATLVAGPATFDGDPRSRQRPLAAVLDALRALGAHIDDDGRGALPFTIDGSGALPGGTVTLDASASSQFVSALLLAGPRFDRGVTVVHDGPPVPSLPHIAMTVAMLRAAGAVVEDGTPDRWTVQPGPLALPDWRVEPDLSNAAPFLAAALVTGGVVRVPGWPVRTTQAGDALRGLLTELGATVTLGIDGLTVTGGAAVGGLDADLHDVGELTPVLAALCALGDRPSTLRGIGHLRAHETDRLAALATEIGALGGDVEQTADGLVIRPRPLHAALLSTYDDHRMAMAAAVLGLAVPGVSVRDIATTGKTLPGFPALWAAMLAGGAS